MKYFFILLTMLFIGCEEPIIEIPVYPIDGDGNIYTEITIGSQIWLKENLKTTKYNDGTDILYESNKIWWRILQAPAYCYYDNDELTYKETYGALYNWFAVETGKLCPVGWRVPANEDWDILINYLGDNAGNKLKEAGNKHWFNTNINATDESGFTGLPGGARGVGGEFGDINSIGFWWTATEYEEYPEPAYPEYRAWYRVLHVNWSTIFRQEQRDCYFYKTVGFSVRCIKN